MLQSQIINVLPRRVLASLWAAQETRLSLSNFTVNHKFAENNPVKDNKKPSLLQSQQPTTILPSFLCTELPVRYTHILRLLSTLSPESLQSPIIRNVAHSYLHDICTLLHPSLTSTSPKAFSNVLTKIRTSQATNLIRLKYALLSNPTNATVALMENINTISFGIHNLIDQHLSWGENHTQKICPEEIAHQAVQDARSTFSNAFGTDKNIPIIQVCTKYNKSVDKDITYVPGILRRILYETSLLSLKAQAVYNEENVRHSSWIQRQWRQRVTKTQQPDRPVSLRIFGGPTSIGFRLDSNAPMLEHDLMPGIPRDVMGTPTCGSILSSTSDTTIDKKEAAPWVEWESLSGWRSIKSMASHWGGNLDAVTVDGLGSTIYLALDRDTTLLERYPSRLAFAASAQSLLHHHRRTAAMSTADHPLSVQAAGTQLDAFLYAISDSQQTTFATPTPLYHHHSVSLSAAVGHA